MARNSRDINYADLIDLHVHSELSFDSSAKISAYIRNNPEIERNALFLTTEHYESVPYGVEDYTDLDYFDYLDTYAISAQKYPNIKFKRGIEIGFNIKEVDKIRSFLNEGQFDLVLLSFHTNDDNHYMRPSNPDYKMDIDDYYRVLINGLNATMDMRFDVITHWDFPFRLIKNPNERKAKIEEFFNHDRFDDLVNLVIKRGLYVEINTSSMYKYGNFNFYEMLLEKYYALGGYKIALGSDSHDDTSYSHHFEEVGEIINSYGEFEVLNQIFLEAYPPEAKEYITAQPILRQYVYTQDFISVAYNYYKDKEMCKLLYNDIRENRVHIDIVEKEVGRYVLVDTKK